jgi:hypothetical protein
MDKPCFTSKGRYEFKYLLKPDVARAAADFLSSYLTIDKYSRKSEANAYTVRSIYFDSPKFECYYAKLGGQRYRQKFRIRTYNHSRDAPVFLEQKVKDGLLHIKTRSSLTDQELRAIENSESIIDGSTVHTEEHKEQVLDKLYFHIYRKAYEPIALVAYERQAYFDEENAIRATLDKNLRGIVFPKLDWIYDEERLEYLLKESIVLEIKFAESLPRWMRSLNSRFHLKRIACSKYCICVAHFLGELPHLEGRAYYYG